MVDTSYLDEDDLADPGIRANVQAMTETNERVRWAAEAEGEAAFGYWQTVDGDPVVVVSLDSEGQYMVVPGRNITEALCASVAEFDDDEFAALASRARELAAETAPYTRSPSSLQTAGSSDSRCRATGSMTSDRRIT